MSAFRRLRLRMRGCTYPPAHPVMCRCMWIDGRWIARPERTVR